VFALILVEGSCAEFPITHKALSRWVVALVIRVKTLEKEVAAINKLAQSIWVLEPEEVSTSPAAAVLVQAVA
jgi:hypothetical protein